MGDNWENEDQFPDPQVEKPWGDSLQPNEDVSHQHQAQYEQELQKPLSKDQKYRRRRKANEQFKDRYIEMLNQENLRLKGEVARLTSEIEKLKQEIALINFCSNLPML